MKNGLPFENAWANVVLVFVVAIAAVAVVDLIMTKTNHFGIKPKA